MSRTSAARAARCESVSRASRGGVPLEDLEHGVLGGDPVALDQLAGVAPKGGVGDHPGVGREDVGVLRAEPVAGLGFGGLGRAARRLQAAVEAVELGGDRLGRDRAGRQPQPARVEHQDRDRSRCQG